MLEKIPLSVAIITKNEEVNLPLCLESIAFADQVVVVDSGSDDNTLDIASAFGCDVFVEPFKGFGPQKQFAIDRCRHDWVLVLDADERLPEETAQVIKEIVMSSEKGVAGYSFPRKNYFQGRWIRHMGWWPDRIVRLFLKGWGGMTGTLVHESISVDGPVREIDAPIKHFTESNLSKVLIKIDRYSTLSAEEEFNKGNSSSVWSAAFRANIAFFQNYFLKLGFLDGAQGFTLSVTDAVNKFFKYTKLSELNKKKHQE